MEESAFLVFGVPLLDQISLVVSVAVVEFLRIVKVSRVCPLCGGNHAISCQPFHRPIHFKLPHASTMILGAAI